MSLGKSGPGKKPNVLFIAVDDLRPELGCYGVEGIKSPNIDALASRGTLFTNAYCQQAVCSPSRTSLMTGLRPDTTRIYDLNTHFRLNLPDAVTLPQHFMNAGYHAQSFSKIYHGSLNDPASWTVPHTPGKAPGYVNEESLKIIEERKARLRAEGKKLANKVLEKDPNTGAILKTKRSKYRANGPSWEAGNVDEDNAYRDGETADNAITCLREIYKEPFFLAVGFLKPHLPFNAPKKYFDLYDPAKLSLASNPFPPKDAPALALTNWGELRNYSDIPQEGPVSDEKARELIHAYYACVSYTDAQIGRVLDELDRLGLRDNTVVVLWGDHGWHLGDHGLWCKHTNFEIATHAPLIVSAPWQRSPGKKTEALVEFVDIYPTLAELCGLAPRQELEGTNMAPLLDNPNLPWKKAAFSQYPREGGMGHTMRTQRYRYTEWVGKSGDLVAVELYDHQLDPKENQNLANLPDKAEVVRELSDVLKAGWRAAVPSQ